MKLPQKPRKPQRPRRPRLPQGGPLPERQREPLPSPNWEELEAWALSERLDREGLSPTDRISQSADPLIREGSEPKAVPKHVGDGRSKETAIHFTNARTYEEHVALQYQWLRANGLESWMQALAAREGGWIYDVHHTDRGKVWFRLPDPMKDLLKGGTPEC